jgi:hypothetical protein
MTTINQYLNHAHCLNEETLSFLAGQKADKDFFGEAQKKKRVEISRMKGERKSDADITARISDDIRKWHQEYLRSGKIEPILGTQETEAKPENNHPEIQTPQESEPRISVPKVFEPWYGNASGAGDEEDSLEKIKGDVEASAQKLHEAVALDDPGEFERRITENLRHLCRIPQRLSALRSREIRPDSYKEVA